MAPHYWTDVHVLIPRSCKFTLYGKKKKDFAGVIKLRVLGWEDDPGLSGWAQCDHKSYKGEAEESELEKVM